MDDRGYWVVVGSPENFATTRANGFTIQGFKSRHRKKAEQMRPGDKLIYYITGVKGFGAVATITSPYFKDHAPIWHSTNQKRQDEDYPWRVQIEPELTLREGVYLPAEDIARGMTYVQKWPADNWTLAFQGNLHKIDRHDFELVHQALVEAAAVAPV